MKKFTNKMKNFWSLAKKTNGGFTLVELIVVIAILAILAGVAVPAYSGYVEKANKQADISLASEVANALTLAYYNQKLSEDGYVILGENGVVSTSDTGENTAMDDALTATFGSLDGIAGLKYDGWKGVSSTATYANTNYYENEGILINEVNKLTDILADSLENITFEGGRYEAFLNEYNIDKSDYTAASNAMVLYVAKEVSKPEYQTSINNAMANIGTTGIGGAFNAMTDEGISEPVALAVIYSYAEGLALYADGKNENEEVSTAFHNDTSPEKFVNITNAQDALAVIDTAFGSLATATGYGNPDGELDYANQYMDLNATDGGMNDLKGFINIMGTMWDSREIIDDNFDSDDCYTDGTVEDLLVGYSSMASMGVVTQEGQMAIGLTIKNGEPIITVFPLNYNK